MSEERKKIKVLSRGPIECCGFIYGPILTPYQETLARIVKMIGANVHVVEVLDDGTEVKLTLENYKKDNSVSIVVDLDDETKMPNQESKNINNGGYIEDSGSSVTLTTNVDVTEYTEEQEICCVDKDVSGSEVIKSLDATNDNIKLETVVDEPEQKFTEESRYTKNNNKNKHGRR